MAVYCKSSTERAPLLLLYGEHAERMAALLRARPSLVPRVVFAPRPALHAIGAFLHLAPEAVKPNHEVAAMLENRDPRDLLRAAIPDAPKRLDKALNRAGDAVQSARFYSRVGAICRGPMGDYLLEAAELNKSAVSFAETVLELDPLIASIGPALGGSGNLVRNLDTIIQLCRAQGGLKESDFRLPGDAGPAALRRRLQHAVDRLQAPPPGFEARPPLRVIRSVGELRTLGKRFKNCLSGSSIYHAARHWMGLVTGEAVFVVCDAPPIMARLRRVWHDLWILEEAKDAENNDLEPDARTVLERALKSSGLRLLPQKPEEALAHIMAGYGDETDGSDLDDLIA